MSQASSDLVLVDELDQPIGFLEKQQVHVLGLRHRAFSVVLFRCVDGILQTLLHRRHFDKYHTPGLWTNACCSHAQDGVSLQDLAQRRLAHEMGIEGVPLTYEGSFHYRAALDFGLIEDEIDHVFVGFCEVDAPPFHPEEVAQTLWLGVAHLVLLMQAHPQQFTPWLPLLWAHLAGNGVFERLDAAQESV